MLGVRVGVLLTLGWALAGIAGSLAGLLVAPTSSFGPYYMDLILVYGFTAAVIGGLESPSARWWAGSFRGCASRTWARLPGSGLEPLGALALLMVARVVPPDGLFSAAGGGGSEVDPAGPRLVARCVTLPASGTPAAPSAGGSLWPASCSISSWPG